MSADLDRVAELERNVAELERRLEAKSAEREEALERQTATAEILKVIASSPSDVQPVFQAIADNAKRLLDAYSAVVSTLSPDEGLLHLAAFSSLGPEGDAALKATYPIDVVKMPLIARTLEQVVEIADTEQSIVEIRELARRRGYRAMLFVPLVRKGRALGFVSVSRKQAGAFDANDVNLLRTFADQAVIAIENARLFDETNEALKQQTATADVLKTISRSAFDLPTVLDKLMRTAAELCGVESGGLTVRDGDVFRYAAFYGLTDEFRAVLSARPIVPGRDTMAGRAILDRGVVQVADLAADPDYAVPESIKVAGLRTVLIVPLLRDGEVVGTLGVNRHRVAPFAERQIELLRTFADQAVIAIENSRLLESERERSRELGEALQQQTATADVLKVISRSAFDLQTVLDTLIQSAAELCGAFRGSMFLRDGDLFRYRAMSNAAVSSDWVRYLEEHPQRAGRGSAIGRAILTGKTVCVPDVLEDPEIKIPAASIASIRAVMAVPMLRDGKVEGVMALSRPTPGAFTARQMELVETFADQAVIAIGNTRLFEEVQARTHEVTAALERQTATNEILSVISRSPSDLMPVLETISDTASRLCGSEQTIFLRFDGEVFRFLASWNFPPEVREMLERRPIAPGHPSALGRAGASLKPVYIPDVLADPDYGLTGEREAAGYRTTLAVPLLREGKLIGALSLNRSEPGAFTSKHAEIVGTFADQAVIAIENTRLFEEVQARTRDLTEALQQQTATSDVLKVISGSVFDLQKVLDTLVDSAVGLSGSKFGMIWLARDGLLHGRAFSHEDRRAEFMDYMRAHPQRPGRRTTVARVALTGEVQNIVDATEDEEIDADLRRTMLTRGTLGVPMKRDGRVTGAIVVSKMEAGPYPQRIVELIETFADQAVIAIENARLFEEVQAKTRDLSEALVYQTGSANILKVIASSPTDVAPVLQAIIDSAGDICEADDAAVLLRDGDYLRFSAHRGPIPVNLEKWPLNRDWVAGRAVLDRKPYHVRDLWLAGDDFPAGLEIAKRMGHRALLAMPLMRDGDSIGAIVIRRAEPQPFSDKQIEVLRGFADQAVIAIGNTRLFDEAQARTRDLTEALQQQTATADVLKVISRSAFDLDAVLETLIESARTLCDATQGMLLMRDGPVLRMTKQKGYPEAFERWVLDNPQPPSPYSGVGRAALTGKVAHFPDVLENPDYRLSEGQRLGGYRALLSVPLLREKDVLGVFSLGRPNPGPFTDRQIELVRTFADQAVIAIENVRLFDEVQARTRDLAEALQQQTATADVLKAISRSVFDLESVLRTLIDTAVRLCHGSRGTIFIRNGDRVEARAFHSNVPPGLRDYLLANPFSLDDDSFVPTSIRDGRRVHLADLVTDRALVSERVRAEATFGAMLCVPLMREGEAIGCFAVPREAPQAFSAREIELVETFADQAVIAIENTRLFEEVQTRTRELEQSLSELRKAQDRLVQSEKLASLGQLTAGIAHEIKNPLNFVNNFSALSRELLGELSETIAIDPFEKAQRDEAEDLIGMVASNLDKVVTHGKRADSIVKNMLLHSREGSGTLSTVNVNSLVEEALNLAYHGARAEKPGFKVTIDKSLDPNAGVADLYPQEMTRVLLNLISNGFYATAKRGLTEADVAYEATVSASTHDLGDRIAIAIRDNGTGIPDEAKAKIFNPFFTTKPAGEGTGLGLSLSHDIVVKQHGGTLEVETEPGVYTQFTIVLPRASRSQEVVREQS